MWLVVDLFILALFSLPLGLSIARSTELFCLNVERGRARVQRGALPQALLDDINDVVAKPRIERARVRVVVEDQKPRVLPDPRIGNAQMQRLRNVVGLYPITRIRAARRR
jgi:Protein of unknown function (DUF3634)